MMKRSDTLENSGTLGAPGPNTAKGDTVLDDGKKEAEMLQLRAVGSAKRKKNAMGRKNSLLFAPGEGPRQPTGLNFEKTEADRELLTRALRENANLERAAPFTEKHIRQLVDGAWKESITKGQILMHEGSLDNGLTYIIADGCWEVSGGDPFMLVMKNGVGYLRRPEAVEPQFRSELTSVRTIGRGHCIGDTSMMFNQPRLVTAVATEPSVAWVICQADFKRAQMSAMEEVQGLVSPVAKQTEKTEADAQSIAASIRFNTNLQRLVPLGPDHITSIAAAAKRKRLEEGQVLMYEGDMNAESFYIVGSGSLEVSGSEPFEKVSGNGASYFTRAAHTGQALVVEDRLERTVRIVGPGHCFGEITMLYCAPRFGTVKALESSVLWEVDRATFTSVQQQGAEANMSARVTYLDKVDSAKCMPQSGKDTLARLMSALKFKMGDVVAQQDETASALLILLDGEVSVSKDGQVNDVLIASPAEDKRHYFATDSLVNSCRHDRTVRVASKEATVLSLTCNDFKETWDKIIEDEPAPAWQRLSTKKSTLLNSDYVFRMENLTRVGMLGHGSLGTVHLVRDEATRQAYTLKTVNKLSIVQRGLRQSMVREKKLWDDVHSPFIVRYVRAVNEPQHVHFLFEAVLGGDLSSTYAQNFLYGSESHTRYYIAGMVYALEYLHSRRIVHRNVKPECVLLTQSGFPKLVSLSLAKTVIGQTFTTCGTPHYMAPEVLAGTGHGRAVDWWSLGVMVFELMSGSLPFDGEHPMKVFSRVMRGIARVPMPDSSKGEAADLIHNLLRNSELDRLPMRLGGVQLLKDHGWFAKFDWEEMLNLQLAPPFVPSPRNESDLPPSQPAPEVRDSDVQIECGDEFEESFEGL